MDGQGLLFVIDELGKTLAQANAEIDKLRKQLADAGRPEN